MPLRRHGWFEASDSAGPWLFRGLGDGTFGVPQRYSGWFQVAGAPLLVDLDGDGRLDVVAVGAQSTWELVVLKNRCLE